MKILNVDDLLIEFQKQAIPGGPTDWCVFIKVEKNKHEKLLMMIRTPHKPYYKFTIDKGNMVTFIDDVKDLSKVQFDMEDEKDNPKLNSNLCQQLSK
jgi:hypothetical protein